MATDLNKFQFSFSTSLKLMTRSLMEIRLFPRHVITRLMLLILPILLWLFQLETVAAITNTNEIKSTIQTTSSTEDIPIQSTSTKIYKIIALIVLFAMSAIFSGLGLGLMSLDLIGLKIVVAAGDDEFATEREKLNGKAAKRIIPLREKGSLLLTTLLLGNVSVNSLASILMADVTSGTYGFIVSTILIVIFGEILPQAVCTRYALQIGAKAYPLVKALIWMFYILAKPASILLDWYLGEDLGQIFTKQQLTEMIQIHEKEHMIDREESGMLLGAMSYRDKTAESIMTPVKDLFMLPTTTVLDIPTIQRILQSGHSRIPVYDGDINNVVSAILVKDLIFVNPKEKFTLSNFINIFGRNIRYVSNDTNLHELLGLFKTESSHVVLVRKIIPNAQTNDQHQLVGLVTLEDVLEEILQDEILDEADVSIHRSPEQNRLSVLYLNTGRLRLADFYKKDVDDINALAAHLQKTESVFRAKTRQGNEITQAALAVLLANCPILEFDDSQKTEEIFRNGVETHFCVVILQGKVQVLHPNGQTIEASEWAVLAAESLQIQEGLYLPEFTVRTLPNIPTRILRISRIDFQQMLHPIRGRTSTAGSIQTSSVN